MPTGRRKGQLLAPKWKAFVRRYGSSKAYWYAPKGLAVTSDSLRDRLKVLKQFEGTGNWRDVQAEYIDALKEVKISQAASDWPEGGAPLARMLKQVFNVLGLAWVDDTDRIEITKAGHKFLEADDAECTLSDQLWRYQFWNPVVRSREHQVIRVHPIAFLGELLRVIDTFSISQTEYTLFAARAYTHNDVDSVAEQVTEFRELSPEERDEICSRCNSYMLGGDRRSSIYNTIKLNRSYAIGMWTLSTLLGRTADGGLKLIPGQVRLYRKYLSQFEVEGAYIDFENAKDWIAYMGDPEKLPTKATALAYYADKGNIAAALAVRKAQNASVDELREFRDLLLSEKQIEDYLEQHLDVIGEHVGADLDLVGRQYSTPVGPIDLLAREKKSGKYVVIELKKGHSGDRVFGQTSRYMGWIRKNLAADAEVAGVIVAKSIDEKLKAARDAHDTRVHLVEFQMRMGSRKI